MSESVLTPNNTATNDAAAATTTDLLGQIQALSKAVQQMAESTPVPSGSHGGKKKRSAPDDENTDPASAPTYKSYGRNLVRLVGPFVRVLTIVEHGVTKALADSDDEAPEETLEQQRLTESFEIISRVIPGFSERMIGLAGDRKARKEICSEIQCAVRGARGDDANSLKVDIGAYIPIVSDESGDPVGPPKFSAKGSKASRGLADAASARLITPVKFPATQETYQLIRDSEIVVLGTDMPYLMYRDGYIYNEADRDDGLLENSVLYAGAKHIYQGPSTALKEDGFTRGRAGNAALNGITALTARDIAYVAVQCRFALSSQQTWNGTDGCFNYAAFYWNVVKSLKGDEGEEIIAKFNRKVFGTSSNKPSVATVPEGPSDFDVLEAQRAAKRARKEAAAPPA